MQNYLSRFHLDRRKGTLYRYSEQVGIRIAYHGRSDAAELTELADEMRLFGGIPT